MAPWLLPVVVLAAVVCVALPLWALAGLGAVAAFVAFPLAWRAYLRAHPAWRPPQWLPRGWLR